MPDDHSLSDAKAKLSALVRQAREGRTILITVLGEPAAEVRPTEMTFRPLRLAKRLAGLRARGLISSATRKLGAALELRPVARRPGALKQFRRERG